MGTAASGAKHDARDIAASIPDQRATWDNKLTIHIPVLGSVPFPTCWPNGGGQKSDRADEFIVEEIPRPPWPIERELTVLLIGMTGAGKSSLGNLLAGSAIFSAGDDTASMTNLNSTSHFVSQHLTILDTIGLGDTKISQENVIASIKKTILAVPTGVDIILLALQQGRLTDDTIVPIAHLMESLWQNTPISNLYVVFTHSSYKCANSRDACVAWIEKQVTTNWRFRYLYSMVNNDPDRMIFLDNPDEKELDAHSKRFSSYSALLSLFASHSVQHIEPWSLPKMDTPSKQTPFWGCNCCKRRRNVSAEKEHADNSNSRRQAQNVDHDMEIIHARL